MPQTKMNIETRKLLTADAEVISASFAAIGWQKPVDQYVRYEREQAAGSRWVRIATVDGRFAGYVTVAVRSEYAPFSEAGIPEIQDLNVLPSFRGKGIGTHLLDESEGWIKTRSRIAGIGVGLHPGYSAAHRLYVARGYIPDGRGVTSHGQYVREGESVAFDDDLVLWMTKQLAIDTVEHNN